MSPHETRAIDNASNYVGGIVITSGHVGIAGNYGCNVLAYGYGDGVHSEQIWGVKAGTGGYATISASDGKVRLSNNMGAYLQYAVIHL